MSEPTKSFAELSQRLADAKREKKVTLRPLVQKGEEIPAVEITVCPECQGSVAKGSLECGACHTPLVSSSPEDVEKVSAVAAARLREKRLPAHMIDAVTKMPVNIGDLVMLSFYYFLPFEMDQREEEMLAHWQEKRLLAEPLEDKAAKIFDQVRRIEAGEKTTTGSVAKLQTRGEEALAEAREIMGEIEPERATWLKEAISSGRKARILPLVSPTEPESALIAGIIKERRMVSGSFTPNRMHFVKGFPKKGLCIATGKVDENGAPQSEFEFYEDRLQNVSIGRVWRQFELRTGVSLIERRKDSNERHYQLDRFARPELITTARAHNRSDNKLIHQEARPEDGIVGWEDDLEPVPSRSRELVGAREL